MTEAFELLKDSSKRQALDVSIRAKLARKERYSAQDSKRKALIDELEEKERIFKRRRSEQTREQHAQTKDLDRIKAENRILREGRDQSHKLTSVTIPSPSENGAYQ